RRVRKPTIEKGNRGHAVPLMVALEDVVIQVVCGAVVYIDQPGAAHRLGRRRQREERVFGSGLDQEGARRDQGTQVLVLETAEHAVDDLGSAHVPWHLVALGPGGE